MLDIIVKEKIILNLLRNFYLSPPPSVNVGYPVACKIKSIAWPSELEKHTRIKRGTSRRCSECFDLIPPAIAIYI